MEYKYKSYDMSKCKKHTFSVSRKWGDGFICNFIMLNPTPTNHLDDVPTIRKCVKIADNLGCKELYITNLFSLRTYNPKDLHAPHDIYVLERRHKTRKIAKGSKYVVVAWGNNGIIQQRDNEILEMLYNERINPLCLGVNKNGTPRHPLLIKNNIKTTPLWDVF